MQKGNVNIYLIVAVVAALVIGGFIYSKKTSSTKTETNPVATQLTTSDISGWNTYTNNNLGLSFMYPKDVVVKERADKDGVHIEPSFYANYVPTESNVDMQKKGFDLNVVVSSANGLTAKQIMDQEISTMTNSKDPTVQSIANIAQKALKNDRIGDAEGVYTVFGEAHSIPTIYVVQNDKKYEISFSGYQGEEASLETQKIIDKILSTFKFTN